MKKDDRPAKAHALRQKNHWVRIQFHTNWNKYKFINCNHLLAKMYPMTGCILCCFSGYATRLLLSNKVIGLYGGESWDKTCTKAERKTERLCAHTHSDVLCRGLLWNLCFINGGCPVSCADRRQIRTQSGNKQAKERKAQVQQLQRS